MDNHSGNVGTPISGRQGGASNMNGGSPISGRHGSAGNMNSGSPISGRQGGAGNMNGGIPVSDRHDGAGNMNGGSPISGRQGGAGNMNGGIPISGRHGGAGNRNGATPISDRLARVANTQDRGRQFFLFFERYRFILLSGQRDDRREINRERVLLQQLQAFLGELEGVQESVLLNRSLALLRAIIAVLEQRIRTYSRNVADAGRIASLVMDYLGDVMHM